MKNKVIILCKIRGKLHELPETANSMNEEKSLHINTP